MKKWWKKLGEVRIISLKSDILKRYCNIWLLEDWLVTDLNFFLSKDNICIDYISFDYSHHCICSVKETFIPDFPEILNSGKIMKIYFLGTGNGQLIMDKYIFFKAITWWYVVGKLNPLQTLLCIELLRRHFVRKSEAFALNFFEFLQQDILK